MKVLELDVMFEIGQKDASSEEFFQGWWEKHNNFEWNSWSHFHISHNELHSFGESPSSFQDWIACQWRGNCYCTFRRNWINTCGFIWVRNLLNRLVTPVLFCFQTLWPSPLLKCFKISLFQKSSPRVVTRHRLVGLSCVWSGIGRRYASPSSFYFGSWIFLVFCDAGPIPMRTLFWSSFICSNCSVSSRESYCVSCPSRVCRRSSCVSFLEPWSCPLWLVWGCRLLWWGWLRSTWLWPIPLPLWDWDPWTTRMCGLLSWVWCWLGRCCFTKSLELSCWVLLCSRCSRGS